MKAPTLSILLTYHNEGPLLTETLASLVAGTRQPGEVLIYDDASTRLPEAYIPDGLPVRVVRGESNVGPGIGRNRLLEIATGDYIHFHDSDDWFHPEWCEVVSRRLHEKPCDVVFTEITSSSSAQPQYENPIMGFADLGPEADLVRYAIRNSLLVPSATIRASSARAVQGFRNEMHQSEDKDFYIRLMASGVSWALETRPLICIRNRPDSRSKRAVEVWSDGLKCLQLASKEMAGRYEPDIANAAAHCATQLFNLDAIDQARQAWKLAERLGGADYMWRNPWFRRLVRLTGPELMETCSRNLQSWRARWRSSP